MGSSSPQAALLTGAALGLIALAGVSAARAEALYLHVVPLEVERGVEMGAPLLHVRLHVRHPERLGALVGASTQVDGDVVDVALSESATLPGVVEERHRRPSFVLDFDEPALAPLRDALAREHGAQPSLEALRDFTGRAIARKTMERGWDLASVVAQNGVGDCTEHAVLLAALARAAGRPARVVVGVLFAETEAGVLAFGHAWAEIHVDGAWRRVDATPVAAWGRVRYLPLFALEDESPGCGMALAAATQALWVREIELSRAP
jgi:hypothetical protein